MGNGYSRYIFNVFLFVVWMSVYLHLHAIKACGNIVHTFNTFVDQNFK